MNKALEAKNAANIEQTPAVVQEFAAQAHTVMRARAGHNLAGRATLTRHR